MRGLAGRLWLLVVLAAAPGAGAARGRGGSAGGGGAAEASAAAAAAGDREGGARPPAPRRHHSRHAQLQAAHPAVGDLKVPGGEGEVSAKPTGLAATEAAHTDVSAAPRPADATVEDEDASAALKEAEALGAEAAQPAQLAAATTPAPAAAAAAEGEDRSPRPEREPGPEPQAAHPLEFSAAAAPAPAAAAAAAGSEDGAKDKADSKEEGEKDKQQKQDPAKVEAAKTKASEEEKKDVKQIAADTKKQEEEEQQEEKKEKALDAEVEKTEAQDRKEGEEAKAKTAAKEKAVATEESATEQSPRPKDIDKLEKQIVRQTDSQGLAEMLGSLEMDIYRLKDQIDKVQAEVKDGVRLKTEDPEKSVVYPISSCMQCILMLAAQYFVVYTAMILCKLFVEAFNLGEGTRCEISLRAACETVFYAPMLCVIFLGAQLRAQQITEGRGGPSAGAEIAMQVCAWSVFVQTMLVLAVPVLSNGAEVALLDEEGGASMPDFEGKALGRILLLVRYVALVSLLLGISVVCYELVSMDTRSLRVEPPDLWDDPMTARTEYAPPLSTATSCSILLMVLFFAVYVLRAVLRSCLDLSEGADEDGEGARYCVAVWEKCMETCSGTMNLAPMLCILFMATRMRALQVEPKLGQLPMWAERSLCGCVAALSLHLAVVLSAWILGIQTSVGSANSLVDEARHSRIASGISRADLSNLGTDSGDRFIIPARAPLGQKIVLVGRGLALGATYTCAAVVAVSIFALGAPAGRPTPPPSPAVRCAVCFAVLYLAVHLVLFFTQAFAVVSLSFGLLVPPRHGPLLRVVRCLRMAEYTVKLCPMLAVLFLGARLRAVQLGEKGGSPQCYAQEAMYSAAITLAVQLVAVLGAAWLAPTVEVDKSCGSPSAKNVTYVPGRVLLETIKICTFVALYGSVVAVGASMLAIRPETAHCEKLGAYLPFLAGLEG